MSITIKRCIHGIPLQGTNRRSCWCTYRTGKYGLINGQRVEFGIDEETGVDKIKRFLNRKERVL